MKLRRMARGGVYLLGAVGEGRAGEAGLVWEKVRSGTGVAGA